MPLTERMKVGVAGLDDVLCGGLPRNRVYLLQGDPGVGKTTLAMQFLLAGVRQGESTLYVTLSESRSELVAIAESHGWSLDGLAIFEMSVGEIGAASEAENTLYTPAEVELGERIDALLAEVDRVRPARVVIDSCSELRLLAHTPLRFRRQILALKDALIRRGGTVLFLENPTRDEQTVLLQSLVHGVIEMQQLAPIYGAERRRLRVVKMREVRFRGGYHDLTIAREGILVFPRLVAAEHHEAFPAESLSSGVTPLDTLLGGGLDRGTGTLLLGPAGSGKSALATKYAVAAAERGESVAIFAFDEGLGTLFGRARALGMGLEEHVRAGRVTAQQIDPAEMSPGEFACVVRAQVEGRRVKMIVIDSLNGYLHAMPEEQAVMLQLHELLSYLRQRGVVTVMVVAQHGLMGSNMNTPIDVSYLADSVVLLRYFEAAGRVRKAISVVKKRSGVHEDTIRELILGGPGGVSVGPPLEGFRGVLTGVPTLSANDAPDHNGRGASAAAATSFGIHE